MIIVLADLSGDVVRCVVTVTGFGLYFAFGFFKWLFLEMIPGVNKWQRSRHLKLKPISINLN